MVMDIHEYEKQKDTLALLKLLALGKQEFQAGKYTDADAFLAEMGSCRCHASKFIIL